MSDTTESPESPGSITRHAGGACRSSLNAVGLAVAIIALMAGVVPASAQQPGPKPIDKPSDTAAFFPRFDFQLEGNTLSGGDPRFMSDAHFGGAAGLLDYTYPFKGRLTIVGDYEAVLGNQYRIFDPNQGIYILEGSGSIWAGQNEIAGVFHHVSRHFSDRPKTYGIAYNGVGVRYLRSISVSDNTSVAVIGTLTKVIARADLDYTWHTDFDAVVRHAVNPHVGVFAHGWGETFTVDPVVKGRTSAQHGGRFEGGVRFEGRGGALELFAGVEHRLDADPHDYLPATWAIAGFRMESK